jgi:hypothetical protein
MAAAAKNPKKVLIRLGLAGATDLPSPLPRAARIAALIS